MQPRAMALFSIGGSYENLLVEQKEEGVLLITLNRPKALNALCDALYEELNDALKKADKNPKVLTIHSSISQT